MSIDRRLALARAVPLLGNLACPKLCLFVVSLIRGIVRSILAIDGELDGRAREPVLSLETTDRLCGSESL